MSEIEEYYKELDPVKRQQILKEKLEGENPFYNEVWEARYGKRKPKEDSFVGCLMELKYLSESGRADLGGAKRKQAASVVNRLMLYRYEDRPKEEQEILFRELENVIRRFISVSKNGRGFSSVLFGMGELSDESVIKKLADQLSQIAFQTPHQFHMDSEFAPLQKAVICVFKEEFPNREHLITK